jgi:hypothetical protein
MPDDYARVRIDAKSFQVPLGLLAATMVETVFREGHEYIAGPPYIREDLATLLRYAASVYNLLFYLNADERRKGDPWWYVRYGVTAMSLVRALIDCLYNFITILEDPAAKGPQYRKSGLHATLRDLDADQQMYGGQPQWDEYVAERRGPVEMLIRGSGFTVAEVKNMPKHEAWPTFGSYVGKMQQGGTLTENQQFLKTFAHLEWRQYSALSHGAYEAFIGTMGHFPIGVYYMNDYCPHEMRKNIEESYDLFLTLHLGRAATVLLCMVTELQAHCRFSGYNINERICNVWSALLPLFEAKELYDARYRAMMKENGISPRE